jgi:hypothetical protein
MVGIDAVEESMFISSGGGGPSETGTGTPMFICGCDVPTTYGDSIGVELMYPVCGARTSGTASNI